MEVGVKVKLGCHVFRATGITAHLEAGGITEPAPQHRILRSFQSGSMLSPGFISFDDLGERAVKNIPRPVHAYSLSAAAIAALPRPLAASDDVRASVPPASRRRTAAGAGLSADPFVGRQREIEVLTRAFEQARAGQGRIVLLAGEPGIGKTRCRRGSSGRRIGTD